MLAWIHGSEASAVRIHKNAQWVVVPKQEVPNYNPADIDPRINKPSIFLGLMLQLKQLKRSRHLSSLQNKALHPARESSAHTVLFAIIMSAIIVAVAMATPISGILDISKLSSSVLLPLLQIPLTFWLTWCVLQILEWLILRNHFPNNSLMQWGILSPRVHRIAWDLGPLNGPALGILALQLIIALVSGYFLWQGSLIAAGIFLASWSTLLISISPFESGPATHLYHSLLGTERIIQLQDQFLITILDTSTTLKGKLSKRTLFATFSLLAWLWIAAASFGLFQNLLIQHPSIQMLTIQVVLNTAGLFFSLWLLYQLIAFLKSSTILRSASVGTDFVPTPKELDLWQRSCALTVHIPELTHIPWNWKWMPTGSQLIRKDDPADHFYWLASGEATVIGLAHNQKNSVFAQLHAGSGIGEIAFLHGGVRTASVYMRKPSVVASIHKDAFAAIRTSDIDMRLEQLVLASQAMDKSRMFQSMPSHAKELWLCRGQICKAKTGEQIIERGSSDTWMGLVISGAIEVERNNACVAVLRSDHVFGEMALWTQTKRQATLHALEETIYLRWESDFWYQEARRHGLEDLLNQLVNERMSDLENY